MRRTYSSLLAETGNDVKVVQELMRHAKLSTTMEVCTKAGMPKKRLAQRRAVDVLFNRNAAAEEGAGQGTSYCFDTTPTGTLRFRQSAR